MPRILYISPATIADEPCSREERMAARRTLSGMMGAEVGRRSQVCALTHNSDDAPAADASGVTMRTPRGAGDVDRSVFRGQGIASNFPQDLRDLIDYPQQTSPIVRAQVRANLCAAGLATRPKDDRDDLESWERSALTAARRERNEDRRDARHVTAQARAAKRKHQRESYPPRHR